MSFSPKCHFTLQLVAGNKARRVDNELRVGGIVAAVEDVQGRRLSEKSSRFFIVDDDDGDDFLRNVDDEDDQRAFFVKQR